jgi:hypothetical protein
MVSILGRNRGGKSEENEKLRIHKLSFLEENIKIITRSDAEYFTINSALLLLF